ncbi:MAG TPA: hypothetical protein VF426_10100 [Marmoricola sp.]
MADPRAEQPLVTDAEYVSYETWGNAFFRAAVTADRVASGVAALSGQPIDFGPIGVGPAKIAKISATGAIGEAEVSPVPGEALAYRVEVPVTLDFELGLPDGVHRFHGDLLVPLVLTARALSGVRIFIEVTPPSPRDVKASVRAEGLRATLVQRIANVEVELRRFVANYVAREMAKPEVAKARLIDVGASVDNAWKSISAKDEAGARVTDDLNEALESEIREREDDYLEDM